MDLVQLLHEQADAIVAESAAALAATHLRHYQTADPAENTARLQRLFQLVAEAAADRNLTPLVEYAQTVARERFAGGYDLSEVHTAFNVLEEVIWGHIAQSLDAEQYPQAFGLVSTVLGAGKQALAVEYVALAGRHHKPSIDLARLFRGTN